MLTQTPMQQFLKLPVLIAHFMEHRAETEDMSFADFIVLHYFSGNPVDDDYDRDQQLPFRSSDIVILSGAVIMPQPLTIQLTSFLYPVKDYPISFNSDAPSTYFADIWQPPKHA